MSPTAAFATKCSSSRKNERPGLPGGLLIHVVHVPKSAGTSVTWMLSEWTKRATPNRRLPFYIVDDYPCFNKPRNLSAKGFRNLTGTVVGHSPFGLSHDAPRKVNVLLVREPIERFLSFFNYLTFESQYLPPGLEFWRTTPLEQLLEAYRQARLNNAKALIEDPAFNFSHRNLHYFLNIQLASIAGPECYNYRPGLVSPPCDFIYYYGTSFRHVAYAWDKDTTYPCSSGNMKAKALKNLCEADIIVDKDPRDFIAQARFHFSFVPLNATVLVKNKAKKNANYTRTMGTPKVRQWLAEWLADEIQVYREAKRLSAEKSAIAKYCNAAVL